MVDRAATRDTGVSINTTSFLFLDQTPPAKSLADNHYHRHRCRHHLRLDAKRKEQNRLNDMPGWDNYLCNRAGPDQVWILLSREEKKKFGKSDCFAQYQWHPSACFKRLQVEVEPEKDADEGGGGGGSADGKNQKNSRELGEGGKRVKAKG